MMQARIVTAAAVVLLGAATAMAQEREDVIFFRAGPLDPAVGQRAQAGVMFDLPVDVLAVEPFDMDEPVTGAPYSAEITTEIIQSLADGNRIERRATSSVARDGQGRVRREQNLAAIGPILPQGDVQIVTIHDPSAGTHYSLDASRKVAIRSSIFTKKVEAAFEPAKADQARQARTESLGTREIEGVTAEGTRTTITIPAGAIGNVAALEIVSERWYSPELRTVVLSRRSDPRFGETIYRVQNIVRVEPPAELFQVPPDYTVETGGPAGGLIQRRIIAQPPRSR